MQDDTSACTCRHMLMHDDTCTMHMQDNTCTMAHAHAGRHMHMQDDTCTMHMQDDTCTAAVQVASAAIRCIPGQPTPGSVKMDVVLVAASTSGCVALYVCMHVAYMCICYICAYI